MTNPLPWTDADTKLARQMLVAGEPADAFVVRLGRTLQASRDRVKRERHKAAWKSLSHSEMRERVFASPAHVIAEAQRRASAPQCLTGLTFGDPPKGYSALDRRNRAEASL
jgi:hypothetical protein